MNNSFKILILSGIQMERLCMLVKEQRTGSLQEVSASYMVCRYHSGFSRADSHFMVRISHVSTLVMHIPS